MTYFPAPDAIADEAPIRPEGVLNERQIAEYLRLAIQNGNEWVGMAMTEIMRMRDYGIDITADLLDKVLDRNESRSDAPVKHGPQDHSGAVVYYVRIGNRIKIGTTINMTSRMASINPEEVLATEPGGRAVEAARHLHFNHARVHGEWFKDCPAIREHIDHLVSQAS